VDDACLGLDGQQIEVGVLSTGFVRIVVQHFDNVQVGVFLGDDNRSRIVVEHEDRLEFLVSDWAQVHDREIDDIGCEHGEGISVGTCLRSFCPADRSTTTSLVDDCDGLSQMGFRKLCDSTGYSIRSATGRVGDDDLDISFRKCRFLCSTGEHRYRNKRETDEKN